MLHKILEKIESVRTGSTKIAKFGTFGGVFTPNVLMILGVIMYLRLGWVVGNAGFLGAVAIIVLAKSVTICTALSMSSITTNIKIGSGGAYSIISKSLGPEAGGSIGIPFYISLVFSAALYIMGFTEGWLRIFPSHPPFVVFTITWILLFSISYVSARLAIKIQYIILVLIGFSILSFIFSPMNPQKDIALIGNFENTNFWHVFAIFFPAVTGIMAGANLSGELKNPRKAIPLGTLSAIGVTLIIYVGLAYMSARFISPQELRTNQMVMVDNALWGPMVILGILGATFSSALASIVGAPRVLQSLADRRTVPFSKLLAVKAENNEPRNAIIFTGIIIEVSLIMGSLDSLATIITMFFLTTYGMLNMVVFIQQSMGIISFRPTFKIPQFVSFFGAVSCMVIMFLISPMFSVLAIITIIGLYIWLTRKGLKADSGDIRGGMFLVLAEKASRIAARFPRHQISWKPDLLIPINNPKIWAGSLLFIRSIVFPSGSIFAFTVRDKATEETEKDLSTLLEPLREQNILVNSTVIEDRTFIHGAKLVIQTLRGGTLRPNTLFLTLSNNVQRDGVIKQLAIHAIKYKLGMIILYQHARVAFGMQQHVNLWLQEKSTNWQLAMLIALQIQSNWEGTINIITCTPDGNEEKRLYRFLERLGDRMRLPSLAEFHVLIGDFNDTLEIAPQADINIFGISDELSFDFMRSVPKRTKTSCLFVIDSGEENALV